MTSALRVEKLVEAVQNYNARRPPQGVAYGADLLRRHTSFGPCAMSTFEMNLDEVGMCGPMAAASQRFYKLFRALAPTHGSLA